MSNGQADTVVDEKAAEIKRLNDALRIEQKSDDGVIVITQGVQAAGKDFLRDALAAVKDFDDFNAENDPHGHHDFGAFDVNGQRLFFMIDYHDQTLTSRSNDPSDSKLTRRVLTVMLASEY